VNGNITDPTVIAVPTWRMKSRLDCRETEADREARLLNMAPIESPLPDMRQKNPQLHLVLAK
jgi:hypothetical protein